MPTSRAAVVALLMISVVPGVADAGVALGSRPIDVRIGVGSRSHALAWRAVGPNLVGTARGRGYSVRAELVSAGAGVELVATIRYRWTRKVWRELVTVEAAGPARSITRDLRFESVTGRSRVDRGTPALAMVGDVVVVPEHGVAATEVRPRGKGHQVRMIAFDFGSHPRRLTTRCAKIHVSNPWRKVKRTLRRRGAVVRMKARLYVRKPGTIARPVVLERWASGAKAAVVFTDHADRTDPEALRALLYGTSDKNDLRYGKAGFFGHGLRLTKTFFVYDRRGGLATDKEAAALADELVARGSEVGLHSIGRWADSRRRVRRALPKIRRWKPVTWIDHQPQTNCEAISNRGASSSRVWRIADVLAKAGMRWIWAATEATFRPMQVNVFEPAKRSRYAPAVFPLVGHPKLWVFRSNWFYGTPAALDRAMSRKRIEQLERERGLFIAHSYLSTSRRTTFEAKYNTTHATRKRGKNTEIHPQIDAVLARLGARARAGAITSLTMDQVGNRLLELGHVRVRYRHDGRAELTNVGARVVPGLTVAVFDPSLRLTVDGKRATARAGDGRATSWFDLSPKRTVTVGARRGGRSVPFLELDRATPVITP